MTYQPKADADGYHVSAEGVAAHGHPIARPGELRFIAYLGDGFENPVGTIAVVGGQTFPNPPNDEMRGIIARRSALFN